MTLRLERLARERLPEAIALEAASQAYPWSATQLSSGIDDPRACLWGASEKHQLLGYALLYRLPFEAELQAITVAPVARRRGVGRMLLARLCEQACSWQSERLLLEVRESNQAARALYAQAGFTLDGRRRDYYRGTGGMSEDALLMSKPLNAGAGLVL